MKNAMLELTRITQAAALAESPGEQVQLIVDAISEVTKSDVCSLYLKNADADMVLVASHGLKTGQPIIIPSGMGLVGRVAQSRHTLNITEPAGHADYYAVPDSDEAQFHSYCGLPLVRRGQVIGVLAVQSRTPLLLGSEQEAFLSTLASHLALMVQDSHLAKGGLPKRNLRYEGISGAAGIAVAAAKLVDSARLEDVSDARCEDPVQELADWYALKKAVLEVIREERQAVQLTLGENLASIIDAHQMLLEDPTFGNSIDDQIRSGQSLLTAIKHTTHYFSEMFRNMEDAYLQARHEDIDQLGNKLYQVWHDRKHVQQEAEISAPIALIGTHISVSDIVSLPTDKLAAIVCCGGAALSHIAVFANALGIPAVMGVGELKNLVEGEQVIVDGNIGQLIRSPSSVVIAEYEALANSRAHFNQQLQTLSKLPAITSDGVRIELMANSGLQADVMPGIRNGADGIGLYRTEIPFMIRSSLPSEEEQLEVYRRVFRAYQGKPVYIRTLDIGGDKPLPYLPLNKEDNPALGWRGVRFTLDNLQLMMTQLRAIIRAAEGSSDVHIVLPMVSTTDELEQCIALLDDACAQLATEGGPVTRPGLGVMVEVPAAISLLPFWHKKIDFVSIGSNDLSQYLLATDRNSPLVGKLYNSLHPAVIHEMKRIVDTAAAHKLPLSLCGEMASDPVATLLLIGLGVRRLSLSSSRLPLIKWLIRSIPIHLAISFAEQALSLDNAQAIRALGAATLASAGVDLGDPQARVSIEN